MLRPCLTGEDARPLFAYLSRKSQIAPVCLILFGGYVCYLYFLPHAFDATLHKSLHSELQQMLLSSTSSSKTGMARG